MNRSMSFAAGLTGIFAEWSTVFILAKVVAWPGIVLVTFLFAVPAAMMVVGQIIHPLTNPITAALKTGPFGGALTLAATPLAELVGLGSLVRSVVLRLRS